MNAYNTHIGLRTVYEFEMMNMDLMMKIRIDRLIMENERKVFDCNVRVLGLVLEMNENLMRSWLRKEIK